jgi:hypothetical protein
MKGAMGHFGETPLMLQEPKPIEQISKEQATLFVTASGIASKNVADSLDKAAALAKSKDIQDFIEANNLGPYLKDVNQERVKAILVLLGVWQLTSWLKSKPGLIVLGSLAGWFVYTKATGKKSNKIQTVATKAAVATVKQDPGQVHVLPSVLKT